jgi:putative hydrolase of the HAD superfamily
MHDHDRLSPPWEDIDTVLLDLDGTLLDLRFDNHFFLRHLPRRLAEMRDLSPERAQAELDRGYKAVAGTLDWYCLDYWERRLELDIIALKDEIGHLVGWRPHASAFLDALVAAGKRRVLATNAHPASIAFKFERIAVGDRLDALYSAHELGAPKEEPAYWDALHERERFDPDRTVFFDDNADVLAAARGWGLAHVVGIRHPDSSRPKNRLEGFDSVDDFHHVEPPLPIADTDRPTADSKSA